MDFIPLGPPCTRESVTRFLSVGFFLHQIASPGPIRGALGQFRFLSEYLQRYSNMKLFPWCKIHRGVNSKESASENFQFIFIMLYDECVHLWSVFEELSCLQLTSFV